MATYSAVWPSGVELTWRDLTWKEYEDICGYRDMTDIPLDISYEIFKTCVISGPIETTITAGIGDFIARHQVANNPFSGRVDALSNALNKAREAVNNDYLLSAQAVVSHVLHYNIEDIKNWTPSKFFLRLAQAEVIIGPNLNPAPQKQEVSAKPPRLPPGELAQRRYLEGQKK